MNEVRKNKFMDLSDQIILSRVKQYLEENVHQTYVDVAVMAKCLQDRYEEYGRRKSVAFRKQVEQAYKSVLKSYGLGSNASSDENNASDLEVMEDGNINTSNHMNDMLTKLYSTQSNRNKEPVNSDELIDISSDESADEATNKNYQKKSQLPLEKQLAALRNVSVSKIQGNKTAKCSTDIPDEFSDKRKPTSFEPQSLPKKRKTNNNNNNNNEKNGKNDEVTKALQQTKSSNTTTGGITGGGMALKDESSVSNRAKRFKKEVVIQRSVLDFRNIGGVNKILKDLCEFLFHIKHPEIYHTIGVSPPTGILLHGPPGCGKTLLAYAIAGQLKIGLIEVPATELIAGVSGESEERIREIFEQALIVAPCVLFIDDIDAISSNRLNAQKDMERRVVSQLISSMDNLSKHANGEQVMVIGATTRPEVLDPALRRVGRFDHEFALGVPDRKEREEILMIICDVLSLEMPFDYGKIAELTPGFVGADLLALATRAASIAVKRRYLSKMQSMQQNIPVVDLIDESQVDNENNPKNNDEETNNDAEGKSVDENQTIEKKEENLNQNGEIEDDVVNSKEEEEEEVKESNKHTPEENSQNEINVNEKENVDDKMDIDDENQNAEKITAVEAATTNVTIENNEEKTYDKTNDAIDVDELSDELSRAFAESADENRESSDKLKRDSSLVEMINYLSSNSLQLVQEIDFEDTCITMEDFKDALKVVQPSAKREGFVTIPDVTWNDIGSLRDIREELQLAILAPVKYPEKMEALGLNAPSGVLLCGPPGCGKTLLAKAIANEAGINFISVKGPELMNMYVGESERAVRTCFQRARNSAPCVIFFDEFDSLCPKRSDAMDGGSGTRVVNQLLTEMDGIDDRKGVFLMAATNRPDIIDPAILRPGRLDTILFVGLPEENDRIEILNAVTKNRTQPVLEDDVDLSNIASQTNGFTGADLAGLVRQASLLALKDSLSKPEVKAEDLKVSNKHFTDAIKLTKPSVSTEDKKLYDKLKVKYAAPRAETQSDRT